MIGYENNEKRAKTVGAGPFILTEPIQTEYGFQGFWWRVDNAIENGLNKTLSAYENDLAKAIAEMKIPFSEFQRRVWDQTKQPPLTVNLVPDVPTTTLRKTHLSWPLVIQMLMIVQSSHGRFLKHSLRHFPARRKKTIVTPSLWKNNRKEFLISIKIKSFLVE